MCILHPLSEGEKSKLGQFVTLPFTSYYKSKEMFHKHSTKSYHKVLMKRAYSFKQTYINPTQRIDVRMSDIGVQNVTFNSKILHYLCSAKNGFSRLPPRQNKFQLSSNKQ